MPPEDGDKALIYDMLDAVQGDYARHWHVIQHELPRLIEELEKIDL
jgi:hypothetical protein